MLHLNYFQRILRLNPQHSQPTFAELKRLLTEQSFHSSNNSDSSLTVTLSKSSQEFQRIEREFIDGWPDQYKQQIRLEEIHKINNPTLESKYQQFVRSNPKYCNTTIY